VTAPTLKMIPGEGLGDFFFPPLCGKAWVSCLNFRACDLFFLPGAFLSLSHLLSEWSFRSFPPPSTQGLDGVLLLHPLDFFPVCSPRLLFPLIHDFFSPWMRSLFIRRANRFSRRSHHTSFSVPMLFALFLLSSLFTASSGQQILPQFPQKSIDSNLRGWSHIVFFCNSLCTRTSGPFTLFTAYFVSMFFCRRKVIFSPL